MIEETWYLLYDGSSADGRGQGTYAGRTTDKKKAVSYFKKCKADPYSTGGVDIVTDRVNKRAIFEGDFE